MNCVLFSKKCKLCRSCTLLKLSLFAEASLMQNTCSTKLCTNIIFLTYQNYRVLFVEKHFENHHFDAICDNIPMNEISNATYVQQLLLEDPILTTISVRYIRRRCTSLVVLTTKNVCSYVPFAPKNLRKSKYTLMFL